MKHYLNMTAAALVLLLFCACSGTSKYKYETVEGDPMGVRIYTLDNGLKVFLARNDLKPRVQTLITVRTGSKNDPAETTGLAHYLEHLMFKGTSQFGTSDYEAEKPLLDEIEALYEVYRTTTGDEERSAIYHTIDSLSGVASTYAIANEYDKTMSQIGSEQTNAHTTSDVTVYEENIPANQIENWARIEADRFQDMVIRAFHTELETVYEEFNMNAAKDARKEMYALNALLFPTHTYGTQTTLGRPEHLKNPSITNIKKYYERWYRPENMAICMVGDLDFDATIAIIDKYWGQWSKDAVEPAPALPVEAPITSPRDTTVVGLEAENILLAWRMPKASSLACDTLELVAKMLYNGSAGLIDQDLNLAQQVMNAYGYADIRADYSSLCFGVYPREGQTLEECRDLLLAEVAKLRDGDFSDSLLCAVVANAKLEHEKELEDAEECCYTISGAYGDMVPWQQAVHTIDRMAAITKQGVVDFARRYLSADSYVCVYKRQGEDTNVKKIAKPAITPIQTGADRESAYIIQLKQDAKAVAPIEPRFIDFGKDMAKGQVGSLPLLYKHNTRNKTFSLNFIIDRGIADDLRFDAMTDYFPMLGTASRTAAQIKSAMYSMACEFSMVVSSERLYISLSGLDENLEPALALLEETLAGVQPDDAVLESLKSDILKNEADIRTNKRYCTKAMLYYLECGPRNICTDRLVPDQVRALTAQELTDMVHGLLSNAHTVLYYGPRTQDDITSLLATAHKVPATLVPGDRSVRYPLLVTGDEPVVYLYNYDAAETDIMALSVRDEGVDLERLPLMQSYSNYFSGSMNSPVFQEMREARGLCYHASADYLPATRQGERAYFFRYIGTQYDKLPEAMATFCQITEDMPLTPEAYGIAQDSYISSLRAERSNGTEVLWHYLACQDLGLDTDYRAGVYERLLTMTVDDIRQFHASNVKGRRYNYAIVGRLKDLDMNTLKQYGRVVTLTDKDIFGY